MSFLSAGDERSWRVNFHFETYSYYDYSKWKEKVFNFFLFKNKSDLSKICKSSMDASFCICFYNATFKEILKGSEGTN